MIYFKARNLFASQFILDTFYSFLRALSLKPLLSFGIWSQATSKIIMLLQTVAILLLVYREY